MDTLNKGFTVRLGTAETDAESVMFKNLPPNLDLWLTTTGSGGIIIHCNNREFVVRVIKLLRIFAMGWVTNLGPLNARFVQGDWSWESVDEYFDNEKNFTFQSGQGKEITE